MANDNLRNLYNTLKSCGYNPPSYDRFRKDMADDNNLRKVHATLQSEGYTPPAFDAFKADMGVTVATPSNTGTMQQIPRLKRATPSLCPTQALCPTPSLCPTQALLLSHLLTLHRLCQQLRMKRMHLLQKRLATGRG